MFTIVRNDPYILKLLEGNGEEGEISEHAVL